ncbi:MAG: hypothetical protein N2652_08430 [Kiritimatiellae bacterium]|nr:hypothetical protein [Kiritimatiellia bacterium]
MNMRWVAIGVGVGVAGAALAQTNVYSKNAVGVIRIDVPTNRWTLISYQLNPLNTSNRVGDVLGTNGIPDGTVVLLFNGVQYVGEEYLEGEGWLPGTNVLQRGIGFWIRAPVGFPLYLTGEVPAETNTAVNIGAGYRLISFPYPVEVDITNSVLNVVAEDGDAILRFTGSGYQAAEYIEGDGWMPGNFKLRVGESYWYKSGSSKVWNEPKNKHYTYP